jgi:hypothetical protein
MGDRLVSGGEQRDRCGRPCLTLEMEPSSAESSSAIQVRSPRHFTAGAVLVVSAYGLVLMLPVLVALLAVSVLPLGLLTWLVPLVTVGLATLLLPFGFGNPYVARLGRSLAGGVSPGAHDVLVQLTMIPRLRSGLRGFLEDADDIGWLEVGEQSVVFRGDAVNLTIGYDQITWIRRASIGWRGFFLYPCLTLSVSGLEETRALRFAERTSWLLPSSRRATAELEKRLQDTLAVNKSRVTNGASGRGS